MGSSDLGLSDLGLSDLGLSDLGLSDFRSLDLVLLIHSLAQDWAKSPPLLLVC